MKNLPLNENKSARGATAGTLAGVIRDPAPRAADSSRGHRQDADATDGKAVVLQ